MKKLLFIPLILVCLGFAYLKKDNPGQTVAIAQIVEHPALNETRRGICDILRESGRNIRIVYENAQGSTLLANEIAKKCLGASPNAIVAIGTPIAQALSTGAKKYNVPVVFSSITDPLGSKIVDNLKTPSNNVTGVSNWIELEPQIEAFLEIAPKMKTLGIIYSAGEANSIEIARRLRSILPKYGLKLEESAITKTSEIADATRALLRKSDALFISNDNAALSAFRTIVNIAKSQNKPVFCSDTDMIQLGATAALGPNQYELGRQTGQIILQILNGTPTQSIPVQFPKKIELATL